MSSIWRLRKQASPRRLNLIEQDYEGQLHVCVVVEDDPGRDIGLMRQPGHRFFFAPNEVEPVNENEETCRVKLISADKNTIVPWIWKYLSCGRWFWC